MSELQNFRSAFNGFNREDVVHYIEYINNKHKAELSQLNTEIQTLQAEISLLKLTVAQADHSQLEQEQAARAALEQELAEVKEQLAQVNAKDCSNEELEAYRRAERVERLAQERANQICDQANGMLADASAKIDAAAAQIGTLADGLATQLGTLQSAVLGSKQTLHDAAAAMYAIRPVSADE